MTTFFPLVEPTDPVLSERVTDFNFDDPPCSPQDLAQQLVDLMREYNGIGLSLNQVGLPYRAFAMEGEPAYVCFNPKIVMPSEEQVILEEGCLSYIGLYVKIKRPKSIKVRFNGPSGEVFTKTFTGMTARVFQHELDHLDGLNFIQRANIYHKEQAFKKWKKWKLKNQDKNG